MENFRRQLVTVTALSAAVACAGMGLFANLPFALAPGMGLNAYFTYDVVGFRGTGAIPWKTAIAGRDGAQSTPPAAVRMVHKSPPMIGLPPTSGRSVPFVPLTGAVLSPKPTTRSIFDVDAEVDDWATASAASRLPRYILC